MAVTWIEAVDVEEYLGVPAASTGDEAFVTTVTAAANSWCFRRRAEAGYVDVEATAPNDAAFLGTVMYAGSLYRQRGSAGELIGAFDGMPTMPIGNLGEVMRLLGTGRPAIG